MGHAAGNATVAATAAGYSAKTAASIGSRLLRKVKIRAAIDARVKSDPAVATREARQSFWSRVMLGEGRFKKTSMKDRLKASELLGKSHGDFVERKEHSGRNGGPIPLTVTFGGRYKPAAQETS